MAHGILQHLHPEAEVCSAGVRPASEVHPLAIKVMAEIGIDISTHYPKNVSQYLEQSWDYVITVCGRAREDCPTFTGQVVNKLHKGFDDPDAFTGPEDKVLEEFRRVGMRFLKRCQALTEESFKSPDNPHQIYFPQFSVFHQMLGIPLHRIQKVKTERFRHQS